MHEGLARLRTDYERLLNAERRAYEAQLAKYQAALAEMARSYPSLSGTVERPLTIPVIFGRSYDENFISDYLAYILDPDRNGIGDEPLVRLLELVVPEAEMPDIEVVEITREYSLGSGRIDLLIDICESAVVGIEAKLWSPESPGQTAGYARAMRREFPDRPHHLIFLTPSGTKPRSSAFRAVSHSQLLQTLREIRYDWRTDVRKSVLWEDFLTHLEVYVVMDNQAPVLSEKTRLYIANHEMLRDLEGAYDRDSRAVFDYVVSRLEARGQVSSFL